jgi:cyclic pyranopterin phosphate synthase
MSNNFSHLNNEGNAHMVDVSKKEITLRTSKAKCVVEFNSEVSKLIKENNLPKGDLFSTVRLAGIMASKKVSDLIPLSHPLSIDAVSVEIEHKDNTLIITSDVKIEDKTGVEMEALTAVTVAGLAAIDMIKSVDPGVKIQEVKLLEKTGGKSGHWINPK